MNEKTLLRIALSMSIIGIIALFIVFQYSPNKTSELNNINKEQDNSIVISGNILNYHNTNKSTSILIQKMETTQVIAFDNIDYIQTGDYIQVKGKIMTDNEKSSFIADEIRII